MDLIYVCSYVGTYLSLNAFDSAHLPWLALAVSLLLA